MTSRISGWTCWDTRGRSSVQPSSSGPIWCRGRWRCDIHLQHNLFRGFCVCFFTFLCLLGLLSKNIHFCRAHLEPKQKSLFRAPPFILTNPTQKEWEGDRTSCQSLETNRRDAVQVKVRLGSWGAEELWFFGVLTRFHFIIVGFFRSSPSPTSLTALSFAAPPLSCSPPSMSTKYCKNIFVSILKEISPHKELLEDNQSLFLMFFKLFVKSYNFLSP